MTCEFCGEQIDGPDEMVLNDSGYEIGCINCTDTCVVCDRPYNIKDLDEDFKCQYCAEEEEQRNVQKAM